ncbi:hypothetical protein JXM67_00505 [candidate division WOR-3 bacterium]|nr:hypothetical protein [candidate division WOR-3 bacterium]
MSGYYYSGRPGGFMRPKTFKMQTRLLLIVLALVSCGRESKSKNNWISADSLLVLYQKSTNECAAPASIHLQLAKDTLALAEATLLTVTVTNNSDKELLLDNRSTFGVAEYPYPFELYLLTPEGENWLYQKGRDVRIDYSPTARLYFWLLPKQNISEEIWLFVTIFAPEKYQKALEKLPSGHYKYYAIYKLPLQKGYEDVVIYSDTAEFVYLPLPKHGYRHRRALKEMNTLNESFIKGFWTGNLENLQRIIRTNTPYSEAAHALLVEVILSSVQDGSYESFLAEKARFDERYPNTPFQKDILIHQISSTICGGMKTETDSIFNLLVQKYPSDRFVLLRQGKLKFVTSKEAGESR